jgi:hypothetical protein
MAGQKLLVVSKYFTKEENNKKVLMIKLKDIITEVTLYAFLKKLDPKTDLVWDYTEGAFSKVRLYFETEADKKKFKKVMLKKFPRTEIFDEKPVRKDGRKMWLMFLSFYNS